VAVIWDQKSVLTSNSRGLVFNSSSCVQYSCVLLPQHRSLIPFDTLVAVSSNSFFSLRFTTPSLPLPLFCDNCLKVSWWSICYTALIPFLRLPPSPCPEMPSPMPASVPKFKFLESKSSEKDRGNFIRIHVCILFSWPDRGLNSQIFQERPVQRNC
jgi:hypothetical protein